MRSIKESKPLRKLRFLTALLIAGQTLLHHALDTELAYTKTPKVRSTTWNVRNLRKIKAGSGCQ